MNCIAKCHHDKLTTKVHMQHQHKQVHPNCSKYETWRGNYFKYFEEMKHKHFCQMTNILKKSNFGQTTSEWMTSPSEN